MKRQPTLNVHVHHSSLENSTRIFREVDYIHENMSFDQVIVYGFKNKDTKSTEYYNQKIKLVRIHLRVKNIEQKFVRVVRYLEFQLKLFFKLINTKGLSVLNCHSLHTLGLGVLIKFLKRDVKLIYDAHELETEVNGLRGKAKQISKFFERLLIGYVDHVIVVSESIEKWYIKEYGLNKISTIRNIPKHEFKSERSRVFNEMFAIPEEEIVYLYQGLLSKTRGVDTVLESFKKLSDPTKHIVFLGFGPMMDEIKICAEKKKNIHYCSEVRHDEIPVYTSSADVGIHLIYNTCLNHKYCLPNKFFEYLNNNLPIIVSDVQDMADFVKKHEVGWSIKPITQMLNKMIMKITKEDIEDKKRFIQDLSKDLNWKVEAEKYRFVFESINAE